MSKRTPNIRYTSRDFDSIKTDLVNYAKKYYPNSYQDFNESSFGSLMVDTVAYVGDILSFYLDYQANESFIDTAIEKENILKLGAGLGYRPKTSVSSTGIVTMYVSIPANDTGTDINEDYMPIIKRGTTFNSNVGNTFTLLEDVVITKDTAEIRKSRLNSNAPFAYVAKVYGKVISGVEQTIDIEIGDFERFRKILIGGENLSEIISVKDAEGNEYYEVDYLTQNVIYKEIENPNDDNNQTQYILKPISVVRRFVVIKELNGTYIQFGGAADTNSLYNDGKIIDPSYTTISKYGKDYSSDESFDPTLLINNDSLGIAPANTTLTVIYRTNESRISSIPARSIDSLSRKIIKFPRPEVAFSTTMASVANSIVVTNEDPIIGFSDDYSSDEVKNKIYGTFAAQNRAVTLQDYKALCYNMPGKLGSIKRVSVNRDLNELKRNINIYVISQDSNGYLINSSNTVKNNLKTWINKSKILNDTIDILDAKIVNFGIFFTGIADRNVNKYDVLAESLNALKREFSIPMDIGETIQISNIYKVLRTVPGLLDVRSVELVEKYASNSQQGNYSTHIFNFSTRMTKDGMFLKVPKNVIMELKYPDTDIEGRII